MQFLQFVVLKCCGVASSLHMHSIYKIARISVGKLLSDWIINLFHIIHEIHKLGSKNVNQSVKKMEPLFGGCLKGFSKGPFVKISGAGKSREFVSYFLHAQIKCAVEHIIHTLYILTKYKKGINIIVIFDSYNASYINLDTYPYILHRNESLEANIWLLGNYPSPALLRYQWDCVRAVICIDWSPVTHEAE